MRQKFKLPYIYGMSVLIGVLFVYNVFIVRIKIVNYSNAAFCGELFLGPRQKVWGGCLEPGEKKTIYFRPDATGGMIMKGQLNGKVVMVEYGYISKYLPSDQDVVIVSPN
jgi:hypothetical protein